MSIHYAAILLATAIAFIVVSTTRLKLHPFLALLAAAFGFGLAAGMPPLTVVQAVNEGFGGTVGAIGVVIIAGTIIGTFLERSGGAGRLADATLRVTGERHVPLAMGAVGWVVSIPVFCDSGFVILSPLTKALSHRAGITLASSAMALSLGLYATHTMVPPTPGPVAAAGILGANLGLVILWGLLASVVAVIAGWVFSVTWAAREIISPYTPDETRPERSALVADGDAPGPARALLPITVPILLIVARSVVETWLIAAKVDLRNAVLPSWQTVLLFAGQPVVALLAGVVLALLLPRRLTREMTSATGWVGDAVLSASTIIIITGAGGAFGRVLQTSGIATALGAAIQDAHLGIWLPFLLAAAIKTAQGSSTVAIITTAGLMAPVLPALGLSADHARALAVVAIGAGSMVVSHGNDSYFWVVTQFSRMTVRQGYRLQTAGTFVEGLAAAAAVFVLSLFLV
jgi:GntP family gluconate:H+ symporter